MYSNYESLEQLEDELYREEEDNSDESEADSELQFHLYSQLHYSSNVGEVSELEDERKDHTNQDNHNIADSDKLLTLSENKSLVEKKKKVEAVKEKKTTKPVKKDKLKNQRASSTWFEEVIVIDSSSDVVTLSDDDCDETEGVCALKGRRLSKLCTSTPAQQVKKNAFPVNVSSSDTESESESESQFVVDSRSSSDSDDLENWMILGHGQQDGDQSISLNLEGVAESETDNEELHGRWLISDRDRQAQISNKPQGVRTIVHRLTNRYYTDKNVHCKNCNRTGHLSKNCPEPKKVSPCFLCGSVGHVLRGCPYKHCNNCGHPGHLYNSCSERSYWHKQCRRCGMTGHFHDECPEVWRQYHITIKSGLPVIDPRNGRGRTPAYCYNCAKKGHFGHECRRQRMFNGTFPSTPFINYYDTSSDIQLRQNRIRQKAKDLKNNAPLDFGPPCDPQSPSTTGPPRKKQKTSSHRRPSFKTDLPASSHIFFSDTSGSIPKNHKPVSLEKPWKPKRPIPQSRDSLPKVKADLDEEDDFPRGGRRSEEAERRKKGKKMKKNGQSLCWIDGTKRGFSSKQAKDQNVHQKKKKKNKHALGKMFPADENLFIIKQRKPKK